MPDLYVVSLTSRKGGFIGVLGLFKRLKDAKKRVAEETTDDVYDYIKDGNIREYFSTDGRPLVFPPPHQKEAMNNKIVRAGIRLQTKIQEMVDDFEQTHGIKIDITIKRNRSWGVGVPVVSVMPVNKRAVEKIQTGQTNSHKPTDAQITDAINNR